MAIFGLIPLALGACYPGAAVPTGVPTTGASPTSIATASAPSALPSVATKSESPSATFAIPIGADGWGETRVVTSIDYVALSGVHESGGAVFTFGRAARESLGLWRTASGASWSEVPKPPALPEGRGGRVTQILGAVGDGLIAAAAYGNPEGGGIEGTALYFSQDGDSWTQVDGTHPGLVTISASDGRLIAARTNPAVSELCEPATVTFEISADFGGTWKATDKEFAGVVLTMTTTSTQVVAAGYRCDPSPIPIIWTSVDGQSWHETSIDSQGSASVVSGLGGGGVLVFGERNGEAVVWRQSGSEWAATSLGTCCVHSAAVTPSGLVVAGSPTSGGDSFLRTSNDGSLWTVGKTFREQVSSVAWTDMLGFVVATDAGSLLVHPDPYP